MLSAWGGGGKNWGHIRGTATLPLTAASHVIPRGWHLSDGTINSNTWPGYREDTIMRKVPLYFLPIRSLSSLVTEIPTKDPKEPRRDIQKKGGHRESWQETQVHLGDPILRLTGVEVTSVPLTCPPTVNDADERWVCLLNAASEKEKGCGRDRQPLHLGTSCLRPSAPHPGNPFRCLPLNVSEASQIYRAPPPLN